jgi:hypothetical protein
MSNPTRYDLRVTEDGAGLYATDEPNTRGMQYVSALDYEALLAERDAAQKDAERYRWLRQRLVGASFDWDDEGMTVLAFEMPDGVSIGADCDKNIDAARAALQGEQP